MAAESERKRARNINLEPEYGQFGMVPKLPKGFAVVQMGLDPKHTVHST